MTLSQAEWKNLSLLSGNALQDRVFGVIRDTASEIQTGPIDNPDVLNVVPRLADLINSKPELSGYREIYSSLARSVGLWNYIDKQSSSAKDQMAAEVATVEELGMVLHREQLAALDILRSGKNLILSAPTSFGKSVLIDALLFDDRYQRVAVVLPTIALLDEFRRRFIVRFGNRYDILMHHSEKPERERVIFLGTQERLINRDDLGYLDLVVVDEFYKLDPNRKDERSATLNAAVYKLLRKSSQFFFLGPNIERVTHSAGNRWEFAFLHTRFATVAVDTFDLKSEPNKEARLRKELYEKSNWPALVFVSSPDKANKLAIELTEGSEKIGQGAALARWMEDNYGKGWSLTTSVAFGIGVHHGRIPRALASRFIKLFNDSKLPVLICTSTLIEGVNTAAKSVLIYDKTIARSSFDFFTFSNIKGRAGRLGQHHVGQVYLFHSPPGEESVEVTAPLFGDLSRAPDEFVVHISEDDTTPQINDRLEILEERSGLSNEELKRFSSLGLEVLIDLNAHVDRALKSKLPLVWARWPEYEHIQAVCSVICQVKSAQEFGVGSERQLTMYIHKLRSSPTIRAFYLWHSESYRGDAIRHDNVFKFLRAAEYSLPEYFSAVELFLKKKGLPADYSLFLAALPRWFRPEELKILEEQGIPIQISERFYRRDDTVSKLSGRLREHANSKSEGLSVLERQWILDALPSS